MRTSVITAVAAVLTAGLLAVPAQAVPGDVVRTDKGPVKGTVTATHREFRAIPFAAPPVGELRWQDPRPAKPWTAPRDATKPGAKCPQTEQFGQPGSVNEDCLHLTVTTPKNARNKPVMVWIHGGGFTNGASSDYDVRKFAEKTGTVVVSVNYRLGVFGNFGHPGLRDSGNYGLADQQAALKWVQRNAKAFGGDPRNVTIFGESAGGLSVCAQLTTPRTAGLFDKAIVQSGPCQLSFATGGSQFSTLWAPRQEVEQLGSAAGAQLGCQDVACLRALPVDKLLPLTQQFARPAFHTSALPVDPATALRDGKFHRVPVMLGSTHDEDTLFTALTYPEPMNDAVWQAELVKIFGAANAPKIAARYPANGDGDARPELSAAVTDRSWACQSEQARRQLDRRTEVFGYEQNDKTVPFLFPGAPPFPYGAYHASELPLLFEFGLPLTPEQRKVADYMIGAWGRFAATGEPTWRHSGVQSFAPGAIGPVDFVRDHQCGFWSSIL